MLGMTVNERLYVSGLLADFDKAVEAKDARAVMLILKKVHLTDEQIAPILEKFGLAADDK